MACKYTMPSYEKIQDIVVYSVLGSWSAFLLSSQANNLFCRNYTSQTEHTFLNYKNAKYTNLFVGTMMIFGAMTGGLFVSRGKKPLLLSP